MEKSVVQGRFPEGLHCFTVTAVTLLFLYTPDVKVCVCVCVCVCAGWKNSQFVRIGVEPVGHPHVVEGLHLAGAHPHPLG